MRGSELKNSVHTYGKPERVLDKLRLSFNGGRLFPPGLRWALIATVCLALVREIAWMPVSIAGNSMAPTLRDGRLVGLNKLAYWRHPPQRGDIVGIWTGKELIIKRSLPLAAMSFVRATEFFL